MSKKIILEDLGKLLFPENYPNYKHHYKEELKCLHQEVNCDDTTMLNIAFKVKTAKYCFEVSDQNLRQALNHLFNYQIDHYYDRQHEYDWHELKSILLLFITLSSLCSVKELEQMVKNKHTKTMFAKYVELKLQKLYFQLQDCG